MSALRLVSLILAALGYLVAIGYGAYSVATTGALAGDVVGSAAMIGLLFHGFYVFTKYYEEWSREEASH